MKPTYETEIKRAKEIRRKKTGMGDEQWRYCQEHPNERPKPFRALGDTVLVEPISMKEYEQQINSYWKISELVYGVNNQSIVLEST